MSSKKVKQKTPPKKKIPVPCLIAAAAAACLLIGYLIAGAVLGSFNPAKWGKEKSKPTAHAVTCAIIYPDLQDSGEIWQTGGMEQTNAVTMREALENDFDKDFFKFSDDGTIASVGDLTAANGYSFSIQKNTQRLPEKLPDKPSEITLVDSDTYEIFFCDPSGNRISMLTDKIKEESAPKNENAEPTESGETSDNSDTADNTDETRAHSGESASTDGTITEATESAANKPSEVEKNSEITGSATQQNSTDEQTDPTLSPTEDKDNIGSGLIFDE